MHTYKNKPHVWIIGFPRCGSASLCEALRLLGWSAIHNPRHWDQIERHNAAGDAWITAHWRELHEMFPDSRFILNTRDIESWLESLRRIPEFWASTMIYDRYLHSRVYGTSSVDDVGALSNKWDEHHASIRELIPAEQLLKFPQPFKWEPLCRFLNVPIPAVEFPWLNHKSCDDARINCSL